MSYKMIDAEFIKNLSREEVKGCLMNLRMSSMTKNGETIHVAQGFIDSVEFIKGSEEKREGFIIQLRDKHGNAFKQKENFFGNFDKFEIYTEFFLSTSYKVVYKDGSFFEIQIYGV